MNITINLAVILFAVCAMSFKWIKQSKSEDAVAFLTIFVAIPTFVTGIFSLCLNWNFTLSNVFRITFS